MSKTYFARHFARQNSGMLCASTKAPFRLRSGLMWILAISFSLWAAPMQAQTISCPSNITVNASNGQCASNVSYTQPTTTLGGTTTRNFSYTGGRQTFVVPAGVTSIRVECWGGQGRNNAQGLAGGRGGYARGNLAVSPGQTLYIYVGGGGGTSTGGGYNGGGAAGVGSSCSTARGGGGGGASDVRLNSTSLNARRIVAGGGGGAGGNRVQGCGRGTGGGGGGGWYGGGGGAGWPYQSTTLPRGGTQSAGGAGGTSTWTTANNGTAGGFGFGGRGGTEVSSGQAGSGTAQTGGVGGGTSGGNGRYSVNWTGQSGAGGSGYVGGVTGSTMSSGSRSGNGYVRFTYTTVGTVTQTGGQSSGSSFPVGTTTNTFTDGNSTCSFTVTVVDNQNPSISCPSNQTVNASSGQCSRNVSYSLPSVSDNCPGVSRTRIGGPASGSSFSVGTTTVTYRATDASGRTATCSFNITVVDNQNPSISCPANQTVNASTGQCSRNVSYSLPSVSDNCPGVSRSRIAGPASGSSFPVGTTTVTYRATDASGRTATCSFNITVNDNQNPSISCPANQTVNAASGQCSRNVSYSTPSAADNCPGVSLSRIAGPASGSAFSVGTTTVTYRATDAAGRTATCSFTITVVDNQNPSIACPANQTVNAASGQCSRNVSYSTPTAADNCPGVTRTRIAGLASGASFPVGTNTVTYRATDASGRTATCSFTITVVDNQNPSIACPANQTVNAASGQCSRNVSYASPTAADNCPGVVTSRTAGPASGSAFSVGTTTVTYLATDAGGRTATCSFNITVVDNQNPSISCPANQTVNAASGQCSRNVSYTTPTAADNCPGVTRTRIAGLASGAAFPVGTNTVTYRATDAGGRTATCSFTITVVDNQNPSIACPANQTVNAANGLCSNNVSYPAPTAADNCPGVTTTRTAGPASGATFSVGTTTITYRATDAAGRTTTCSFNITVVDNQNPSIACPANQTINAANGQCSNNATYAAPTAADNCPGVTTSRTAGPASGSAFSVGTTTVTYRATDASGRTATCSFTITVVDNQNPSIACPANQTVNAANGLCTQNVSYATPTAADNCPGVTRTRIAGLASGAAFPVGNNTVTYRATDAGGRTATCSFTITVIDNQNPAIACPANLTVNNDPGQCNAAVTYSTPGGTDNCPGASTSRTAGLGSGATFPIGTTTETYRVTDASGNTASCSFTVTVNDNENPVIACPANISVNNASGQCSAVVTYSAPGGTDNCPGANTTRTAGLGSGGTFPVGSTTETYSVTDAAGNTSACSFTITVNDNENPVIACPANITVNSDPGQCSAVVTYTAPGGTDNCPGASTSRTAGLGSGGTFPAGTSTETYRVTDASGNTAACSFTITVNDNENPAITCPANITVNNDPGQCDAVVSYTAPGGTDNCPGASTTRTAGLGSGGSFPVGTTTETYRVTDASGNTADCSFIVTVNDNENPAITCPANLTVNNDPGQCSAVVTYTAPGGTDNCPGASTSRIAGLGSGATFAVGTTTERYRVTDAAGNTATCAFTVTVEDNENPAIACPANITVNSAAGQCDAVVTYSAPGGTDNCPGASTSRTAGLGSGGTFPVGSSTETYQVTDAAGNTASCSFTVTVNDNEDPFIACPANITVNNDPGNCSAVVTYSSPGGTDNCPGASTSRTAGLGSGSAFPVGTTSETYTVTDASGNTASCSFVIRVNDNENPAIACPANITVNNDPGNCDAVVTYSTPGGTDNCPGASTSRTTGLGSGGTFPVGTTTETYVVTDAAGNTASCNFDVTVNDNENPVIACPANITVNNDPGNCDAVVTYSTPGGTDNCPGANTAQTAGLGSGGTFAVGTSTESYQVTDAAGNTANCSFTVTVVDNEDPVIACPANITVNSDSAQCSAVVAYSLPGGLDNCPGAVTIRSAGLGSGGTFPIGTSTETYLVTDASGNTASCSFTITVNDNEDPVIACPANITVNNDPGNCDAVVTYSTPGGTDNCPGATTVRNTGLGSGAAFPVGTTSETYTVTDASGNTASCSFTVRVNDNENPAIACPANITVNNDPGNCDAVVTYSTPGGTDNCPGASTSRTTGLGSGGTFPVGTTTETYVVTDAAGNTASCNFDVTVNDNENPVIACPANITVNNDPGNCDAVVTYSTPGGTDNCPGANTAQTAGLGSGGTFAVGTSTESYQVTDAAGNTANCSFTVTVVDNEDPVIACPANIIVNSDSAQCSAVVAYSLPGGVDNCPGAVTTRSAGLGSGGTFPIGTSTETYLVTDASGNTASCSFTITVNDNEDPVIACPANITVNNDPGNCDAVVTYSTPGGTDNCPGATTVRNTGLGSGAAFPVGTTSETYTVTDASGNTASCSFTVRVNDNENPAIACPANITVNNDPGNCDAVVTYSTPGGTDNCPGASTSRTTGLGSGGTFPVGTTTETYVVTDAAGNTASCNFDVTVNDNENPVIACPANITVNNDPGNCDAVVTYSTPGGTDNCPGANTAQTAGLGSGGTFAVGTSAESYQVTDAAGNTANCSFTITVIDNEAPAISCPANITVSSVPGQCDAPVSYATPGGVDNCPGAVTTRTAGLGSGANYPVGTTTETYLVTDASGNTDSCSFTIRVDDNESPFISCPANVVVSNDPGNCSAVVTYATPGGVDNCPGAVTNRTTGLGSGATFPVGNTTETYVVTDAAGNTSSCAFSITVNDNEAPAVTCPANITVSNDPGQCSAVVTYATPGGTDNCPGAVTTRTQGLGSGGTFAVGLTTESYLVTDAAGNTDSCSFTVRVNDNENPVIACPANITVSNDPGQCSAVVTYSTPGGVDNCPGSITNLTAGLGSGGTFAVGLSTESYLVTDAAGNTDSCSFTIRVNDNENPVIACPANITVSNDPGQCSAVVTYSTPGGVDNCPGALTVQTVGQGSGATFPVGNSIETYQVTDASGNTDSCSFSITVNDNENPVIACPANVTVSNDPGNCSAVVSYAIPGGTDNCPGASTSRTTGLGSGGTFPVGTTTETYVVTDAAGNTASCNFDITVNDNEDPVIACPANITVSNDPGQCSAVVTYATPGGTDNCPGSITNLTAGLGSGGTFAVGLTTESYLVTDAAGNTDSCSFTIRVNDNEDPVIACPANITVNNDPGQCSAVVTYSAPGGVDNCPGANTVLASGLGSGGTFSLGGNTETYTVTDAAGNNATCSFTITVIDNEDPVIVCPANITVNNDPGQCSAVVTYSVPGGVDNCPGANTVLNSGLGTGGTYPVGTSSETYTVTDGSGNTASCSFSITVNDAENPAITCPANIAVNNDPGLCAAVVTYSAPGGTDNCPGAVTTLSSGIGSGSSFAVGVNTETYTVTDAAGNAVSCSFTVTVTDNEAPVAQCQAQTIQLDANGNATLSAFSVNNNSTDNCALQSLSLDTTNFSCNDLGANTVTLTVTDIHGNNSTCTSTITVEDNVAPAAVCQNLILQLPASGDSLLPPVLVNGGSSDNCTIASFSLDQDQFVCNQIGLNAVTLYVTDQSGNVDSCSATITVVDTLGLTRRWVDLGADTTICNLDTLQLDAGPGFSSYAWSTGGSNQTLDIHAPGSYNVVATDSIGCIGQDTFTLIVDTVDNPNIRSQGGPAIVCLNDTLGLESDSGYVAYVWSTGDTNRTTLTSTGGNIFLTVTEPSGCSRTDTFFVDQRNFPDPNPIIDPVGDTINLCGTDPVLLNVRGGYASYNWNTGDTTQMVTVGPGTYYVTVTNGFGCWNVSEEKFVQQVTPIAPSIQVNGDTLCASSGSNYQWYFNGNAIILANSQCYVASVPGSYWVQVDDIHGCPINSDTLLIVNVKDRADSDWNISAYPNPFSESTFISFEAPERSHVNVEVFSLTGVRVKTLMDREVFAGEKVKLEFDPDEISGAVYIYRLISSSGQSATGKLIFTR